MSDLLCLHFHVLYYCTLFSRDILLEETTDFVTEISKEVNFKIVFSLKIFLKS